MSAVRWVTCPVCERRVRVNKDGTIRAHYGDFGPTDPVGVYCAGSREVAP